LATTKARRWDLVSLMAVQTLRRRTASTVAQLRPARIPPETRLPLLQRNSVQSTLTSIPRFYRRVVVVVVVVVVAVAVAVAVVAVAVVVVVVVVGVVVGVGVGVLDLKTTLRNDSLR